jgi:hypothetical protein
VTAASALDTATAAATAAAASAADSASTAAAAITATQSVHAHILIIKYDRCVFVITVIIIVALQVSDAD